MIKKLIYKLFGNYFFDREGLSKKNIISYSYTPDLGKEISKGAKLTSESKVYNFFYWLYSDDKIEKQ